MKQRILEILEKVVDNAYEYDDLYLKEFVNDILKIIVEELESEGASIPEHIYKEIKS